MAHCTVAVATVDVTRLALLNALDNAAMRHLQLVVNELVWQVLVADDAFLRVLGTHVSDKILVRNCLLLSLAIAAMAGNTA